MFRCLSPGCIGINVELEEELLLASAGGFEGLEINISRVASQAESTSIGDIKQRFREAGVLPGGWGLPLDFRGEDAAFDESLKKLPRLAETARELGCTRTATWISPASDSVPFDENFKFHQRRLGQVASILHDYGCSLGLEFIGPATLRRGKKYEFIYTMPGMLELAAACGPNCGLLLDCWHWYTSGATVEDLKKLTPAQVVYVHVNDAPSGVPVDEQIDNVRCLPGETGVIDIVGFLQSLQQIGYDGPITPEPFSPHLGKMPPAEAAQVTGKAMKKIWGQAGLG